MDFGARSVFALILGAVNVLTFLGTAKMPYDLEIQRASSLALFAFLVPPFGFLLAERVSTQARRCSVAPVYCVMSVNLSIVYFAETVLEPAFITPAAIGVASASFLAALGGTFFRPKARQETISGVVTVPLVGIVLLVCVLSAIGRYTFFPLKGLCNRVFRMPAVVSQPFVTELQEDSAIRQRKEFLDAWRAGRTMGLHRQVLTVEGDPVHLWVITERKTLRLITDYTRDPYSDRSIDIQNAIAADLYRGQNPTPLRAWFLSNDEVYLRLEFQNGNEDFF